VWNNVLLQTGFADIPNKLHLLNVFYGG